MRVRRRRDDYDKKDHRKRRIERSHTDNKKNHDNNHDSKHAQIRWYRGLNNQSGFRVYNLVQFYRNYEDVLSLLLHTFIKALKPL